MSKSLTDAMEGKAWSVTRVMHDLNDVLDDEGRPIAERRADVSARAGVKMEMRECPYSGIRHGRLMNVSALEQIAHHYNAVMSEIAALRKQLGGEKAAWSDILAVVLDQLAGPAIRLLKRHVTDGRVQAQIAVGHKLAEGIFGVMRTLHERRAIGVDYPVTAEAFIRVMEETNALVGASEACAGSPQMIRKTVNLLVAGGPENGLVIDQDRVDMARLLARQIELGIFWQLYDQIHLWELVRGKTREVLHPSNDFLMGKLRETGIKAAPSPPPALEVSSLPASLDTSSRQRISNALQGRPDQNELQDDMREIMRLLAEPGAVIRYQGEHAAFAECMAQYLNVRRNILSEQEKLERELRRLLELPIEAPIRLGPAAFPEPQALPWYEMTAGCRLGDTGHLNGRCNGVRHKPV